MKLTGKTRHIVALTLAATAVIGVGGAATNALFVDSTDVVADFTAGTVAINVDGNTGSQPYVLPLDVTNFAPGVTRTTTITLNNTGTLDASYTGAGVIQGVGSGLADALQVTARVGGSTVYTGKLSELVVPATVLAAGASQALALDVTAPAGMSNSLQGAADALLVTFAAQQHNVS